MSARGMSRRRVHVQAGPRGGHFLGEISTCSRPGATVMNPSSSFVDLERLRSSYLLLATLAGRALAAGVLYQIGLIGWVLRGLGLMIRGGIREGFRVWERLLAWASWPLFLALVFGFLVVGGVAGGPLPGLRVVCGLA